MNIKVNVGNVLEDVFVIDPYNAIGKHHFIRCEKCGTVLLPPPSLRNSLTGNEWKWNLYYSTSHCMTCKYQWRKLLTYDNLYNLYVTKKLSTAAIGRMLNVNSTTILNNLKRLRIPINDKRNYGSKNGMYHRKHSEESLIKIRAANKRQFDDPENRRKHALLTIKQIQEGRTGKSYNQLETTVSEFLQDIGIEFIQQYNIGRFVYDFFIPKNNTLLEAHGRFWHADPRFYDYVKLSEIQIRNIKNDVKKHALATSIGMNYQVVWEDDIKELKSENPDKARECFKRLINVY